MLPLKLRFKYSSDKDFIITLNSKFQRIVEKNRDYLSLSLHDRITVENTTSVGGIFVSHQHQLFDYAPFDNFIEAIFRQITAAVTRDSSRILDD